LVGIGLDQKAFRTFVCFAMARLGTTFAEISFRAIGVAAQQVASIVPELKASRTAHHATPSFPIAACFQVVNGTSRVLALDLWSEELLHPTISALI
jgi:hypothetical protein